MNAELSSRAARLGTSTLPTNTDTTWIGFTPGFKSANNYWSIWSGFGKDGFKRPVNGQPNKGSWNWEQPINGDSLQGWWPVQVRYFGGVGLFIDRDRSTTAADYGNNANYRINQGNGRTYGVTGVWHVDNGNSVPGPTALTTPNFNPLVGQGAAWMGLRAHGDLSYSDAAQGGTNNYFNEDVMQFGHVLPLSSGGNDKGFPGYGSQMDQMLYRDIDFSAKKTGNLVVRFAYRTVMSTSANSTVGTRTGWYDKDPLAVVTGATNPQLNNFISSDEAGDSNAPRDSFMVYVGSGVDGNQWLGSDGVLRNVYDPQRRWFAEVLHTDRNPSSPAANPQPLYYKELLSVAGNNPVDAPVNPDSWVSTAFTIPNSALQPFLAKNNKIRLVFRVKTNRGNSDDEGTAYNSNRSGAAEVDNVEFRITPNAAFTSLGAFETPAEINNSPAVPATQAWKSTGKPRPIYFHPHLFSSLPYDDICGDKGDPGRVCDMTGVVISMGDHDRAEASNGPIGTQEMDRTDGMFSPTIQLAGPFNGPGGKNAIGLLEYTGVDRPGDVNPSSDFYLTYDIMAGIFNPSFTGNYWDYAAQAYPGNSKPTHGSYPAWGYTKVFGFIIFNPDAQCLPDFTGLYGAGILDTSNPNGIPDSLRVYLGKFQRCFRLGLTTNCGRNGNAYFDNVSVAILDGTPQQINVDIWQWYNDAFPANEAVGIAGVKALFDTTAAWIKTGVNNSQTTSNRLRYNIPGDSVFINTSGSTARLDMVFRVLPGPGNYQPIGQGHSGNLRRLPSNPATVTVGDGSWWDVYRRFPGDFCTGSPGTTAMTDLKAGWNPNFWVSARCDTAEQNLYAFQGRSVQGGPPSDTDYMSTYHESDAKYNLLGINHFICFVRCSICSLNDILCNGTVPLSSIPGGYLPAGTPSTSREQTKIIPDGLLTPGAHVEYFFRDQKDLATPDYVNFAMMPDTNVVFPNDGGNSVDGHRWQEFSILPDRWKDPQYVHPVFQRNGRGPACLLVVDNNDRRGNERVFVSIADTTGATEAIKYGAHNGWHSSGNINPGDGIGTINDPQYRVAVHGGSPGTTWDMFQVKASESLTTGGNFGSRLANRAGQAAITDKSSRTGPTPDMLNAYYTLMLFLSGDLNAGVLGPFKDRASDDVALIKSWLLAGSTSVQNRGIWAVGDGFVESSFFELEGALPPNGGGQLDLLSTYFGTGLFDPNYIIASGNSEDVTALRLRPEWLQKPPAAVEIYGMRSLCLWTNDILELAGIGLNLGSVAAEYDGQVTPGGNFLQTASIFKDWAPTSQWKALVDGWDIEHLTSRRDVNTVGRSAYYFRIFSKVWSKIWNVVGTPVIPLDVPSFDDGGLVNFVNLKNNPLRRGAAEVDFGLAKADRVEVKVYDVGGRLVRTLVDRFFEAGPHKLVWDGVDNGGRQVPRGVYFTQVKYQNARFALSKKLIVLK